MKPEKRSVAITTRIAEAQTRLAAIETDLAGIPREQQRILTADTFDNDALATLEAKGAALTREQTFLRNRVEALVGEREKAETEEAQARLNDLPAEAEKLRAAYAETLAGFNAALIALNARAKELGDVRRTHGLIVHEGVYLVERYKGVTRSPLGPPPLLPNFVQLGRDLQGACYASAGEGHLNEWEQKRQDWANAGRQRPALRQVA